MTEMDDYSGKFNPVLTFEDLSKNALIKMLKEICMLYLFMSESWAAVVKERYGDEVSFQLDMENWRRIGPYASQRLREAMNIKGNDVETWFKALQVDPGWGPQVLLFNNTARSINPNMVGRPLKLPPRESKDEIACVWEFKIEE